MAQGKRRADLMGVSAGILLIALAIAIIIAWVTNDWWLLFPIILIELGVYTVAIGMVMRTREQVTFAGTSDAVFTAVWGVILSVVGVLMLVNYWYPDNLPLLVSAFLIVMAIALIMMSLRRSRARTS